MRLSTEPRPQRCTAACEPAKWARPRHLATWLRYETRISIYNTWMTSTRRLIFSRAAYLATEPTQFTSAVSQPLVRRLLKAVLRSCNAPEYDNVTSARTLKQMRRGQRNLQHEEQRCSVRCPQRILR